MNKYDKVNLKDKYRALLTDVLPYELPIWFDASQFYHTCKNKNFTKYKDKVNSLEKLESNYIPLEYKISRGSSISPRVLSIMHPFMQVKVCDFYEKHHSLIKYYASRSPHSLRHPYRLARKFFNKDETKSTEAIGLDVDGYETKTASSYFKYRTIAFLYKFFEGYEYHRLEKRFSRMLQVDIAKCFPSIYTHSIGWATKSKRITKKNLNRNKGSFDDDFDRLMQETNYRETNGIIIGPEISRIFAEIILQKIDLNVVKTMREAKLFSGQDYEFKRYVDDYFVFFNNEETKTHFLKTLENCLLEYKLYLNESKTEEIKRPFVTKISLAKNSIKEQLSDFFSARYIQNPPSLTSIIDNSEYSKQEKTLISQRIKSCPNPGRIANQAIARLKYSFFDYAIDYQSVSNFLMGIIERKLARFFKIIEENLLSQEDQKGGRELNITNWLLVDLDILFFVHAMDLRIRPTDRLARCIIKILDSIGFLPEEMKNLVQQKIFDGLKLAINIVMNNKDVNGLETLNLLTILGELPSEFTLEQSVLLDYHSKMSNSIHSDDTYFLFITFMLYTKNDEKFLRLNEKIINNTISFIKDHSDRFISTEFFILFFDFLACPYIDRTTRETLYSDIFKHQVTQTANSYFNEGLFIDWKNTNFVRKNLEKKSFVFAYA